MFYFQGDGSCPLIRSPSNVFQHFGNGCGCSRVANTLDHHNVTPNHPRGRWGCSAATASTGVLIIFFDIMKFIWLYSISILILTLTDAAYSGEKKDQYTSQPIHEKYFKIKRIDEELGQWNALTKAITSHYNLHEDWLDELYPSTRTHFKLY